MDAAAALEVLLLLAASSAAINEAKLLIDFMIEPRFSDAEFLVFWFGIGMVSATSLLFLFSGFFGQYMVAAAA
jgi:hypothetical protein